MHWGVSSSRKEDADKPRNLQPGGRAACFSFSWWRRFFSPHSEQHYKNLTWGGGDYRPRNSLGPGWSLEKPQSSVKIEKPFCLSLYFSSSWGPLQNWGIYAQATLEGMTTCGQAHLGTSGLDCTLGDVNGWVFESDGARVREHCSRPAASLVFLQGNHLLISALAKTNKSTSSSKYGHNSHWEMFNSLYEQFRVCVRGTTSAKCRRYSAHESSSDHVYVYQVTTDVSLQPCDDLSVHLSVCVSLWGLKV